MLEKCPDSVSRPDDQNPWQTRWKKCRGEGYLTTDGGERKKDGSPITRVGDDVSILSFPQVVGGDLSEYL
jgi:hypothetical protein